LSFLPDTNVVSETRKRIPDQKVKAWLEATDAHDLYISVLTMGELAKGIARRRERDPHAAASLVRWLRGMERLYSHRVIPIDRLIAAVWGELNVARSLPVIDSLLAATAKVRGFTLVTRNTKEIATTGVPLINPWG
jgi:predicted nucleic acid-binding protein